MDKHIRLGEITEVEATGNSPCFRPGGMGIGPHETVIELRGGVEIDGECSDRCNVSKRCYCTWLAEERGRAA